MQLKLPIKNTNTSCTINKKPCFIIKRSLLIVIVLPFISLIPYYKLNWSRNLCYVVLTSGLSTYIFLLNFPIIVKKIHERPTYYEDLEELEYDNEINPLVKKRFQIIFVFILQLTLTLISSGMIYYYYNHLHNTTLTKLEIFGVLGGSISLMLKIENCIGTFMLLILHKCKSQSNKFDKSKKKIHTDSLSSITGF
jgi:hypothetical protein